MKTKMAAYGAIELTSQEASTTSGGFKGAFVVWSGPYPLPLPIPLPITSRVPLI